MWARMVPFVRIGPLTCGSEARMPTGTDRSGPPTRRTRPPPPGGPPAPPLTRGGGPADNTPSTRTAPETPGPRPAETGDPVTTPPVPDAAPDPRARGRLQRWF